MQRFIFLHQVKTAGKTVEKFLLRKFKEKYCLTTKLFQEETVNNIFSILSSEDKGKIAKLNAAKVISGHFSYGLHNLLDDEARYFTLLRDPVSRIRSYYAYSLRNEGSKIHAYLHDNNIGFEQFVEMEKKDITKADVHELNYVLEDGQCKLVAGEDLLVGEGSTAHLFDKSEENIARHFDFVGVTELFDDAFIEISKLLGMGLFNLYITQNKSQVDVDVSERARKVILERNAVDSTLHHKYYSSLQGMAETKSHRIARFYSKTGSRAADFYVKLRS